jgi:hypothetical protein
MRLLGCSLLPILRWRTLLVAVAYVPLVVGTLVAYSFLFVGLVYGVNL